MLLHNKILWEKWVDPFGRDIEESKWLDYEDNENNESSELLEEYLAETSDINSIRVIASPLGIIPYNEHTASSKIFNFWVGHTNFSITPSVVEQIEQTDGVETLDIFTRYRFRIAIGKCFKDADVMSSISDTVKNNEK